MSSEFMEDLGFCITGTSEGEVNNDWVNAAFLPGA